MADSFELLDASFGSVFRAEAIISSGGLYLDPERGKQPDRPAEPAPPPVRVQQDREEC